MKVAPLAVVSALFVSVACSTDPSGPGPAANDARLQVVPGVASVASVDVLVDGVVVLRNAAYGVPSSVIELPRGAHVVRVVPANGAPAPGGTPVTLRANDTTRVVVIGTSTAMNTVALGDTGAAPVPGKGKLRVTHLATNAPPIDVYRSQPDFTTFTRLMFPFPYQASSPFVESTPGNWVIRVTPQDGTQVLAESGPIRVDALWVRTVLLLDAPGGGIKITPLGEQ